MDASPSRPSYPTIGEDVDFVHSYVQMPGLQVTDPANSSTVLGHLCTAAMGDSFAAGTTDGPGMFDFTQGANSSNPFWHFIAGVLHRPTAAEKACQAPKGILLPTGRINIPWAWAPDVLPFQVTTHLLSIGRALIPSTHCP